MTQDQVLSLEIGITYYIMYVAADNIIFCYNLH
jgi:hypothetical protein